uniref:KIND domain-containing protein n=1 Tax=Anopheles atroparvus TaxID=41427 RepID=A0A182IW84_ANOAO
MASETETPVPACPPAPDALDRGSLCRKVSPKMAPRSAEESVGEGDRAKEDTRIQRVGKIGGGGGGGRRTEPGPVDVRLESVRFNTGKGAGEHGGSGGRGTIVVASGAGGTSVTLEEILKTFNAPISEDQAWALIFQASRMFKARLLESGCKLRDLRLPLHPNQLHVQKDGSCFVTARTALSLLSDEHELKLIMTKMRKPPPQMENIHQGLVYAALALSLLSDERELKLIMTKMSAHATGRTSISVDPASCSSIG